MKEKIKHFYHNQLTIELMTLIMVMIAVLGFFYTIYRANLNQAIETKRASGFQILVVSNELQSLIDINHYSRAVSDVHYIGWSKILYINDLAMFMDKGVQKQAKALHTLWQSHATTLKEDVSNQLLSNQINLLKQSVKSNILQFE